MKLDQSLTEDNINQNLLNIKYAVHGPILERAIQIEEELKKGVQKPFDRVVRANNGDCQALGQKPITFIRQVLALAPRPELMALPEFPPDVKERVTKLLDDCTRGSIGPYSPSNGLNLVRARAAEFISARDGVPASPEDIFLGSGASDLIKTVLTMFAGEIDGKKAAVMLPVPQYPLFSGTLEELGVAQASYYLDEQQDWTLRTEEMERCYRENCEDYRMQALVVINPGNPTGQVLNRQTIEEVIKFAYEHNLFLLADEVYQENIVSKPFYSFKKVMFEMGAPYSGMELASFVTCSKGWAAECGVRSGYVELVNLPARVREAFDAVRGLMQCPNVPGQFVMDCVVKPPVPGEPSYELYAEERRVIHRVLTERTSTAYRAFNDIPGYSCNVIEAAMCAFPRIKIPERAQDEAARRGVTPDEFYCMELLEETGLCVVPGSGFGQEPGTFHFRTTILHPEDEFHYMLNYFRKFQINFLKKYS